MIILCSSCHSHLGWRYLADEDNYIIPRIFYGLSMRSITSHKDYLLPDQNRSDLEDINDGDVLMTF